MVALDGDHRYCVFAYTSISIEDATIMQINIKRCRAINGYLSSKLVTIHKRKKGMDFKVYILGESYGF